MGTVVLTEPVAVSFADAGESLFQRTPTTFTPGPADSGYLRRVIGDDLYDAAVAIGVIVEIP